MFEVHFGFDVLKGFLFGELTPEQNREVVLHLLDGCSECQEFTRLLCETDSLWDAARQDLASPYAGTEEGAWEESTASDPMASELAREREMAMPLVEELARHPLERQFMLVANSRRYSTWGVCELLIESSWKSRFDDAIRTLERAQVAVVVAEGLDMGHYGMRRVQDLKGRAWAYLGNAHRIGSDYHSCDEALRVAEMFLDQGTGECSERAMLWTFKAALSSARNHFEEAEELYDRVLSLYRRAGDRHGVGVILMQKGVVRGHAGELESAIRFTRESLEVLAADEDVCLILAAHHNLVQFLHWNGDLDEALLRLREATPRYVELGDRLNLIRLSWLEGKIHLDLGNDDEAENALTKARDGFLEQGIGYDAAEISLDLAALYLRRGRNTELRELAAGMLPIFQSQDMHREVTAALLLFEQAVHNETASVELITELLEFLKRARDNPDLRFEPSHG